MSAEPTPPSPPDDGARVWIDARDLRRALIRGLAGGCPGLAVGLARHSALAGIGGWVAMGAGLAAGALLERATLLRPPRPGRDGATALLGGLLPALAVAAAMLQPIGGLGDPRWGRADDALGALLLMLGPGISLTAATLARLSDQRAPSPQPTHRRPGFGDLGQAAGVRACFRLTLVAVLAVGLFVLRAGGLRESLQVAFFTLVAVFVSGYVGSLLLCAAWLAVDDAEGWFWPPEPARE